MSHIHSQYHTYTDAAATNEIVLRREMSTEIVLQLVWSSTRAVVDVASFTMPM